VHGFGESVVFYSVTMSIKHVFDDANGLIDKALLGAVSTNPDLRLYVFSESTLTL